MPPKQEGMIFKATYSGVPVYECIIKGVAVMRRRSDGWINATHVLKVVGLDKPQRTRVLERDVQKGTHEKVQGGYGKYQGTWIPLEDAIRLAETYNVSYLFDPITSYVPSAESPPPAPKHIIATSNRAKKPLPVVEAVRSGRRATSLETESESPSGIKPDGTEGSMSDSPSDVSSSSRTPSPIINRGELPEYFEEGGAGGATASAGGAGHGNGSAPGYRSASSYARGGGSGSGAGAAGYEEPSQQYADIILNYFISETTTVPPLLVSPPNDFDPNMSIDDDEHTALHWACAMGRIRVVKLLLTAGADVFRVNLNGQTALMRAAMFSNNYDLRKFPELFELLHRSILNIDRNDRTVFHHIVDLALTRGKPHAARYYLETILHRLADYGSQLADILNFADDEGETALTLAARARSKRLTRLLLEHGADPKIRNKEGKSAEDYIVEDERFRASPVRTGVGAAAALGADGTVPLPTSSLHTSEAGQRAGGKAVTLMTALLHSLAESYDAELSTSERKLTQAHGLLAQIQSEIADSTKTLEALEAQGASRDEEKRKLDEVQRALRAGAEKRSRQAMENGWNEAREEVKRARTDKGLAGDDALEADDDGSDSLLKPSANVQADVKNLSDQVSTLKKKRTELLEKFVDGAREQGTGKTMASYRRLIAAGCGGIAQEEVDAVVSALCELLEDGGANNIGPGGLNAAMASVSGAQQA